MEFLPKATNAVPKNLYPCLATITVTAPGPAPASRRLSYSFQQDNEDNALSRVISGGRRRKSSFGTGTGTESATAPASATNDDPSRGVTTGTWYWRVQAGVTETHLVLLPLSTPPNPLLKSPPAPLSEAMPAHSVKQESAIGDDEDASEHTGFMDKLKHTLHIGSPKKTERRLSQAEPAAPAVGDKIIDQTATGGTAGAVTGATPSTETSWPGVVGGEKLASIVIPIQAIEKGKVTLGGGKKGEASWVNVSVLSHFQTLAHSMLESVGAKHHESWGKSGSIKFEFDKEWIGAKGEAELLHHHLTNALANPAPGFDAPTDDNIHAPGSNSPPKHRTPFPETFQLRQSDSNAAYESLRKPDLALGDPVTVGGAANAREGSEASGKVAGI